MLDSRKSLLNGVPQVSLFLRDMGIRETRFPGLSNQKERLFSQVSQKRRDLGHPLKAALHFLCLTCGN